MRRRSLSLDRDRLRFRRALAEPVPVRQWVACTIAMGVTPFLIGDITKAPNAARF